jgi:hypothetical protein
MADARRAAHDFVFLWTNPSSLSALREAFDFTPLAERMNLDFLTSGKALLARSAAGPGLVVYGDGGQPRVELEVADASGYETRAGMEYPTDGLRVVRLWRQQAGAEWEETDLRQAPIRLPRLRAVL